MKLEDFLVSLAAMAKRKGISEPFVVGGYPRNCALGLAPKDHAGDIDMTTGDAGSTALAMEASRAWPSAHFRSYDDGHTSLQFQNLRVDFSNNFKLPGIDGMLAEKGITTASDLQREMFSRDFTVNCLLQSADLSKEPEDPTGMAREDLDARILRTPVDPDATIGHDPRRILRALKFSIRFGMKMDDELEKSIVRYRGAMTDLPFSHVKKQVNQMLKMDPKKAIETLSKYRLLPILPLSKLMAMEMAKHRMIQHLLDGAEEMR